MSEHLPDSGLQTTSLRLSLHPHNLCNADSCSLSDPSSILMCASPLTIPFCGVAQPQQLLLPQGMELARREKNWVPFVYDDGIHFIQSVNPHVVVRLPPMAVAAEGTGSNVVTELVSSASQAVRWRYGEMRGGTQAVYDVELGAYLHVFHSQVEYFESERHPRQKLYFMGCYVFAAQPPFAIQLLSQTPLIGPAFYPRPAAENGVMRVVFPAGLMLTPDELVISYGKNDYESRLARFDRRNVTDTLQPPLPASWQGKDC